MNEVMEIVKAIGAVFGICIGLAGLIAIAFKIRDWTSGVERDVNGLQESDEALRGRMKYAEKSDEVLRGRMKYAEKSDEDLRRRMKRAEKSDKVLRERMKRAEKSDKVLRERMERVEKTVDTISEQVQGIYTHFKSKGLADVGARKPKAQSSKITCEIY